MTANWQLSSGVIRPQMRGERVRKSVRRWRRGKVLKSSREEGYRYSSNVTTRRVYRCGINPRRGSPLRAHLAVSVDEVGSRHFPRYISNDTVRKVPVLSHLPAYLCATYEERGAVTNGHRVSLVSSIANKICCAKQAYSIYILARVEFNA